MRNSNNYLLLSDARGIYIPRDFVESFDVTKWGLDPESWEVKECQNPESEHYWNAWTSICDNAKHVDSNGIEWSLYQNGDLWAVAYDWMTDEEKENFFGN